MESRLIRRGAFAPLAALLIASLAPLLAAAQERPSRPEIPDRHRSTLGMVVEVTRLDGERVILRDAVLARKGESLATERDYIWAGSRRYRFSEIRSITVNRVTPGMAAGRDALGGGTYGDVELVGGQVLPDVKMTWSSVFGWERPARQGEFHDIEAKDILRLEFFQH